MTYLSRDVAPLGDQSGSIEGRGPGAGGLGTKGEGNAESGGGHDRLSVAEGSSVPEIEFRRKERERERERERRGPGEDSVSTEGLTHRLVRDASVHVRLVWAGGLVVASLEFLYLSEIAGLSLPFPGGEGSRPLFLAIRLKDCFSVAGETQLALSAKTEVLGTNSGVFS